MPTGVSLAGLSKSGVLMLLSCVYAALFSGRLSYALTLLTQVSSDFVGVPLSHVFARNPCFWGELALWRLAVPVHGLLNSSQLTFVSGSYRSISRRGGDPALNREFCFNRSVQA